VKATDVHAGDVVTIAGDNFIARRPAKCDGDRVTLTLAAGRTDPGFEWDTHADTDLPVYRPTPKGTQ